MTPARGDRPAGSPRGTNPFRYTELPPAPALAAHVLTYWTFEARLPAGARFTHHVWPDGCISFVVPAIRGVVHGEAILVGPAVEASKVTVEGGVSYRGARFRPDAGGAFLGHPAESLSARAVPAAALLGPRAGKLAAAVAAAPDPASIAAAFDASLTDWARTSGPIDPAVRQAVRAIISAHGKLSITQLAATVGLSPRQLQRRFRRAVGVTAKEYARIRRVRSVLDSLLRGDPDWSRLAHALGFADQPHLVRELGDLTGLTPVALRERLGIIDHVDVMP